MNKKALAYKDNFWSALRVERGFKIREVSDYLGIPLSVVGSYFSGQLIPPPTVIVRLCEFFDVDLSKGEDEFKNAHNVWRSEHKRKLKMIADTSSDLSVDVKVVEPSVDDHNVDDILGVLYGTISYTQFLEVSDCVRNGGDVLQSLYGKIDYATYGRIASIIGGKV